MHGADDLWAPSAWWKLHLGWIRPTVVTRDGYYDVRQAGDRNPEAFLLYDPDKGVNDYFLVENRQALAGTSDANINDSGLVVWRVIDANAAGQAPFEVMRSDGGNVAGTARDAFDPSDPATPQRAMTAPWQDGTAARVAVRAIGRSAATMRAFFDVRGPGVLVDTNDLDDGDPSGTTAVPHLSPGDPTSLTFPVMNTGEVRDSFDFTITGLPAGWSATTDTRTLDAGQGANATVQVAPPLGARADQVYPVTVSGRSRTDGSVGSTAPLRLRVLPKVSIDDVTVTEGDAGTQDATFTVSLSEAPDRSVAVDVATPDGTATAPGDYEARTRGLRFADGATIRRFTVPVKGDSAPSPTSTSW